MPANGRPALAVPLADDEALELVDLRVDRIDGVRGPATHIPFLVMKAQGRQPTVQEALRALASPVVKAEASTATQNDHPDSDFAYVESGGKKDESGKTTPRSLRHFPIYDKAHAANALARAPQSPFGDKAMPKIKAAAKKFGIEVASDVTKAQEATVSPTPFAHGLAEELTAVRKDMNLDDPDAMADLGEPGGTDATDLMGDASPNADGDGVPTPAPGSPDAPGDPAWEAVDAARARQATAGLVALRNMVSQMRVREATEVVAGQADDSEDVWALDMADDALDCALGVLAKFAVDEQSEADRGTMMMAGTLAVASDQTPDQIGDALGLDVEKALGMPLHDSVKQAIRTAFVGMIGGEGPIEKVGARLSSATQSALKQAMATMSAVLDGTLDAGGNAPAADDDTAPAAAPAAPPAAPVAASPVAKSLSDIMVTDEEWEEVVKSLADPEFADVFKSMLTETLDSTIGPRLTSIEQRLARVEGQPADGGPVLKSQAVQQIAPGGALPTAPGTPAPGSAPVLRPTANQDPRLAEIATLEKSMEDQTLTPKQREEVGRRLTRSRLVAFNLGLIKAPVVERV